MMEESGEMMASQVDPHALSSFTDEERRFNTEDALRAMGEIVDSVPVE
jgi:hypothetical protein